MSEKKILNPAEFESIHLSDEFTISVGTPFDEAVFDEVRLNRWELDDFSIHIHRTDKMQSMNVTPDHLTIDVDPDGTVSKIYYPQKSDDNNATDRDGIHIHPIIAG